MFNSLISVIIPVYNVEDYVERCIQSVRSQSYANLQIILIDDGSTDSSGQLCDQIKLQDERIEVFHTINQGLSSARNYGMEHVKGDYVVFVDSDDYIGINHIKNFVSAIEKYPEADLVITGNQRVFENSDFDNGAARKPSIIKEISTEEAITTAIAIYDQTFAVTAWGKMYKSDLFSLLFFPPGKLFEDNYIFYKVFCNAHCIVYEDANDYCYLLGRPASITSKASIRAIEELNAYDEMIPYIEKNAPLALEAVLGNYAGRLIRSYSVAREIRERDKEKELYSLIVANRSRTLSLSCVPTSTRFAHAITFLGRPVFNCALSVDRRLRRLKLVLEKNSQS